MVLTVKNIIVQAILAPEQSDYPATVYKTFKIRAIKLA